MALSPQRHWWSLVEAAGVSLKDQSQIAWQAHWSYLPASYARHPLERFQQADCVTFIASQFQRRSSVWDLCTPSRACKPHVKFVFGCGGFIGWCLVIYPSTDECLSFAVRAYHLSSDHELVSSLCLPTVSYRKRKQTRFVSILWAVILIVSAQITFAGLHAQSDASGSLVHPNNVWGRLCDWLEK